jgi:hypothetical protein
MKRSALVKSDAFIDVIKGKQDGADKCRIDIKDHMWRMF